jgi:pimeloyl-ACP methyl ester carboxylesterase
VLGTAFKSLVPLGAIAGGVVYLAFVLQQFTFTIGVGKDLVVWLAGLLATFEGETLVAAGKWFAGGAVTIAALGSRFTQTFGRLRVAIDAVLDIDNYFGDPPNRQPPRARIYSRYASLLAYLRERGYARIVIVAHSQGTVISADLLRHLQSQGRLQGVVGALPIALVTVGSPLRDLYAERFPLFYRWVGPREAAFADAAPTAAELGASEWVNACRSGDYVGRFIWTPDSDAARFAVATVGPDGSVQARRAGDRTEFCLGAGGHTHYFSNDAVALAVEIDRLVA